MFALTLHSNVAPVKFALCSVWTHFKKFCGALTTHFLCICFKERERRSNQYYMIPWYEKQKYVEYLQGMSTLDLQGRPSLKLALHVLASVFCVFYVNIADEPEDWLNSFWTSFALAHRHVRPHFHARTWLEKHHSWFIREQVIRHSVQERDGHHDLELARVEGEIEKQWAQRERVTL